MTEVPNKNRLLGLPGQSNKYSSVIPNLFGNLYARCRSKFSMTKLIGQPRRLFQGSVSAHSIAQLHFATA